jgi:hypothetical protein
MITTNVPNKEKTNLVLSIEELKISVRARFRCPPPANATSARAINNIEAASSSRTQK